MSSRTFLLQKSLSQHDTAKSSPHQPLQIVRCYYWSVSVFKSVYSQLQENVKNVNLLDLLGFICINWTLNLKLTNVFMSSLNFTESELFDVVTC